MRVFHTAAAAAVLLMAASAASAQPFGNAGGYVYAGLGYTHLSTSESDIDFNLSAIHGRLGFMFNPCIGIEGEGAFGIGDETVDFGSGVNGTVHIESDWAGYLIGMFPLGNENFNVFGRIGYGQLNSKVKLLGISESGDDNQWRIGFGVQGFIDGVNGIRAEYTNLGWLDNEDDSLDADVFSISYVRRFR
jgi:opacity protein-like surface antigen